MTLAEVNFFPDLPDISSERYSPLYETASQIALASLPAINLSKQSGSQQRYYTLKDHPGRCKKNEGPANCQKQLHISRNIRGLGRPASLSG